MLRINQKAAQFSRKRRSSYISIYLCLLIAISANWGIARADILVVPSGYTTIQQAIIAATPGDTISVAPGTYVENINFLGKAIAVQSQSGRDVTTISGNPADPIVKFSSNEGNDSKLDGFTVQFGAGGGIAIYSSSPTVGNNRIINSSACNGSGIFVNYGSPIIKSNLIKHKSPITCDSGLGNGIELYATSTPGILENTISDNRGEGIYLFSAGAPLIRNNLIYGNFNDGKGGGISMVNSSDPLIVQNQIYGNRASEGGGIYWLVPSGSSGPLLINNTIADNNSITGHGSGIYADGFDVNTRLVNNIVTGIAGQSAIYCGNLNDTSSPIFQYNDVFSSAANAFGGSCFDPTGLSGNISINPLFGNTQQAAYCLDTGSPAIDAGDNNQSDLPTKDLLGGARITDGDLNGSIIVDMGAYEHDATGAGALTFSSSSYISAESNASIVVTVTRHCASSGVVTVYYTTNDGTATAGSDYQSTSGTLTLHEGESSASFSIPIISDALEEEDETVGLTLSNPTGGAILGNVSFATLIIRKPSTVHFSAEVYSANEVDGNKVIEVTRDNTENEATVDYSSSEGTAKADLDYTGVSGTLTFTAGQSSASFTVPIIKDSEHEVDETVLLSLRNPLNGAVLGSPASAELTIHNADVLTRDYFPLTPGSEWKYLDAYENFPYSVRVPFELVTINKVKTRSLKSMIDGSKSYFTNDSQGIRLHRFYFPRVPVPGYGVRSLSLTASPPVLFAAEGAETGQTFNSQGSLRAVIYGLGSASMPYTASYTFLGYDTVKVPAGTYNVIKLKGEMNGFGEVISETYYLAKGIGMVKYEDSSLGETIVSELLETNTWMHDLAINAITPPTKVVVTAKKPAITKTVRVTIQNRSPHLETIADTGTLAQLVNLKVESLGICPAPIPDLITKTIQKRMPISLRPKQTLNVDFTVTFNCANDPKANTLKNPGHEDYRYTATVNRSMLDGYADVHEADDVCPRTVIPPYVVDSYPDGKIKDRGCGLKKPDKTFGANVITDVLSP